jgi:ADP-ribose pyrophosphatase
MAEYKRVGRKLVHKGKILSFYTDEIKTVDGKIMEWDYLDHKGAAAVIPVDDKGRILMVRQYRGAVDQYILEIPAGGKDPNEDMMTCAARELEEETGYRAGKIEHLIDLFSVPAYCNELLGIYYATDLIASKQNLDEGEYVRVERYEMDELIDMIMDGRIQDSKTVASLLAYQQKMIQKA